MSADTQPSTSQFLDTLRQRHAQREIDAQADLSKAVALLGAAAERGYPGIVDEAAALIRAIMPQSPIITGGTPPYDLLGLQSPHSEVNANLLAPGATPETNVPYVLHTWESLAAEQDSWQERDGIKYATIRTMALLFDGPVQDVKKRSNSVRNLFTKWVSDHQNDVLTFKEGTQNFYASSTIETFVAWCADPSTNDAAYKPTGPKKN